MSLDQVDHLRAHPVLAILRGVPSEHVLPLGLALVSGGVRSLEVAFTDFDADAKITALSFACEQRVRVIGGATTPTEIASTLEQGCALGLGIGGALTTRDWSRPDWPAVTTSARTFTAGVAGALRSTP